MLYLCILLYAVLFAGIAMTVGEGLWSNTLSLLAIWLAATLAVALGPGLGVWAQVDLFESDISFTWQFIFAGIWLVFFVSILIIRVLFDKASKVRLRFIPQLDAIAGPLMGVFVAIVFASFCTITLMVPIQAGAWSFKDSGDWQKTTVQYLRAPMLNMLKAWAGEDRFGDLK